jgi:Flp pilus assembly protein TadG
MSRIIRSRPGRSHGQALVEFALSITVLVVLLMGVFDLGRGIYMFNGVSEAAREVARATSVDSGNVLGAGPRAQSTIATQKALVPALDAPTFECVDIDGSPVVATPCPSAMFVRVTATATYRPVSILGLAGPITLRSVSSVQIP